MTMILDPILKIFTINQFLAIIKNRSTPHVRLLHQIAETLNGAIDFHCDIIALHFRRVGPAAVAHNLLLHDLARNQAQAWAGVRVAKEEAHCSLVV